MLQTFAAGLAAYRAYRWEEAMQHFQHALRLWPTDQPSRLYLERCAAFLRQPPPPDWDGVYVMHSK